MALIIASEIASKSLEQIALSIFLIAIFELHFPSRLKKISKEPHTYLVLFASAGV